MTWRFQSKSKNYELKYRTTICGLVKWYLRSFVVTNLDSLECKNGRFM